MPVMGWYRQGPVDLHGTHGTWERVNDARWRLSEVQTDATLAVVECLPEHPPRWPDSDEASQSNAQWQVTSVWRMKPVQVWRDRDLQVVLRHAEELVIQHQVEAALLQGEGADGGG